MSHGKLTQQFQTQVGTFSRVHLVRFYKTGQPMKLYESPLADLNIKIVTVTS